VKSLNQKLDGWLSQARREPSFRAISDRFAQAGILNWLQEDEKLLLFSIGAYAPGKGTIVEIDLKLPAISRHGARDRCV
jgi:hypothetical protein